MGKVEDLNSGVGVYGVRHGAMEGIKTTGF